MNLFDFSTMPLDQAVSWDPTSIAGQAILREKWKGVDRDTRRNFLRKLNSKSNLDTFVSKLMDFDCFLAVVIESENEIHSKIIVLENFQRFTQGPIFYGPYNWPDSHE